jgi:hypothetical protein
LSEGPGRGDPVVQFPETGTGEQGAFDLLHQVVRDLGSSNGPVVLSGLKNQLRKRQPDFTEKKFGYGGFLQFCKAAVTRGVIDLTWDEEVGDYSVKAM